MVPSFAIQLDGRLIAGHVADVEKVEFTKDGTKLVSVTHKSIRIWSVPSGRLLKTVFSKSNNIRSCAWNPDGSMIAILIFDQLRVLSLDTESFVQHLSFPTSAANFQIQCYDVQWSTDDDCIVTSRTGALIWSVSAGSCVKRIEGDFFRTAINMNGSSFAVAKLGRPLLVIYGTQ